MGIFDVFKKKKPEEAPQAPQEYGYGSPAPAASLTDYVLTLKQQGYTQNQIIQALQRQGYSPAEIYDAVSQAEAPQGIEPYAPQAPSPEAPTAMFPQEIPVAGAGQQKNFEEIAEQILEEKWQDFMKEHAKFSEWQDQAGTRIERIEQSVTDMKADLENLHKAIVSKISEYDKNLLDVGTEIKAMEKVFQKVLPELTGSVTELSRITRAVKTAPESAAKRKGKK